MARGSTALQHGIAKSAWVSCFETARCSACKEKGRLRPSASASRYDGVTDGLSSQSVPGAPVWTRAPVCDALQCAAIAVLRDARAPLARNMHWDNTSAISRTGGRVHGSAALAARARAVWRFFRKDACHPCERSSSRISSTASFTAARRPSRLQLAAARQASREHETRSAASAAVRKGQTKDTEAKKVLFEAMIPVLRTCEARASRATVRAELCHEL
jgi:hypothetical protein